MVRTKTNNRHLSSMKEVLSYMDGSRLWNIALADCPHSDLFLKIFEISTFCVFESEFTIRTEIRRFIDDN